VSTPIASCLAAMGVIVILAGCGSGSPTVVRPPTSEPATGTVATKSPTQSAPASASGSGQTPKGTPMITVRPAHALRDGQRVRVAGTGFTPGEVLQVIQCADKGQQTGPGDCNLSGMLTTAADATGRVAVTLAVTRGPFGANAIVCSVRLPCLVSVTQASLSPSEEADAEISFGIR
jgi:hypothetical protein